MQSLRILECLDTIRKRSKNDSDHIVFKAFMGLWTLNPPLWPRFHPCQVFVCLPHKPLTSCPHLSWSNPGWFSFLYRAQNFSGAEDVPVSLCTEQNPSVSLSKLPAFPLDALCSLTITCKQCTKIIIHGERKKWVLFLTHRRFEWLLVTPALDYLWQIYTSQ